MAPATSSLHVGPVTPAKDLVWSWSGVSRGVAGPYSGQPRGTVIVDLHPGDVAGERLKRYWLTEGLSKWAFSSAPWTELFHHLAKHVDVSFAKRLATVIFHEYFGFYPGSDLNRVTHGKAPKGKVIGPG
jgi:hypothetical protein